MKVEAAPIPQSNAIDTFKIESGNWTYTINSLERKSKKNYSLSASAGYTFDNSTTKSDSVDASLSGTVGGLTLGAGVSMPVGTEKNTPTVTLSATLSPNSFIKNSITKQQNDLTEEQELLSIQSAEAKYETAVVESQQKLETLLWEQKTVEENLSMYEELEKDTEKLYRQGFVSESDYLSAKTDRSAYTLKKVTNQLDLIIYNDEVIMNFVSEE